MGILPRRCTLGCKLWLFGHARLPLILSTPKPWNHWSVSFVSDFYRPESNAQRLRFRFSEPLNLPKRLKKKKLRNASESASTLLFITDAQFPYPEGGNGRVTEGWLSSRTVHAGVTGFKVMKACQRRTTCESREARNSQKLRVSLRELPRINISARVEVACSGISSTFLLFIFLS